mmetsp:Transcript_45894/g.114123  ORF Transcript_45894/g.114123 Transcript_45894/m.114123 type:complete len:367 (+) Transcript_45894:69-1169(+)
MSLLCGRVGVCQPLDSLSVLPHRQTGCAILHIISSFAVLLAAPPEALIAPAIGPLEYAEAVLFVVFVHALIGATVGPLVAADAIHQRANPCAAELTAVLTGVVSVAVYLVVSPLARIAAAVGPKVDAHAVLLAVNEGAFVLGALLPLLYAIPVLLVVLPLASVGALVLVYVCADAPCGVLVPLADVLVAVGVHELALAMRLVLNPLTFIAGAVSPGHLAVAVPLVADPLSLIDSSRLERVRRLGGGDAAAVVGDQLQLNQLTLKVVALLQAGDDAVLRLLLLALLLLLLTFGATATGLLFAVLLGGRLALLGLTETTHHCGPLDLLGLRFAVLEDLHELGLKRNLAATQIHLASDVFDECGLDGVE